MNPQTNELAEVEVRAEAPPTLHSSAAAGVVRRRRDRAAPVVAASRRRREAAPRGGWAPGECGARRLTTGPNRSFFPAKAVLQRSFLCVIPAPRVADSQKRLLAVAVRSSRDDYATPFVCGAASGLSVRTSCGSRKKAKVHHNFPPYSLVYFEVPGKKQRSIIIPQNEGGKL